jgi:hypothetical protein
VNPFPNSPFNLANKFIAELEQGVISSEEFLRRMDLFEQSLEKWHEQLESISTSTDYPEGAGLLEDAKESVVATYEGVGILREFTESRDAEAAQEALELFKEASDLMIALIRETEQNMEELEDDRSNAIGGDLIG